MQNHTNLVLTGGMIDLAVCLFATLMMTFTVCSFFAKPCGPVEHLFELGRMKRKRTDGCHGMFVFRFARVARDASGSKRNLGSDLSSILEIMHAA